MQNKDQVFELCELIGMLSVTIGSMRQTAAMLDSVRPDKSRELYRAADTAKNWVDELQKEVEL